MASRHTLGGGEPAAARGQLRQACLTRLTMGCTRRRRQVRHNQHGSQCSLRPGRQRKCRQGRSAQVGQGPVTGVGSQAETGEEEEGGGAGEGPMPCLLLTQGEYRTSHYHFCGCGRPAAPPVCTNRLTLHSLEPRVLEYLPGAHGLQLSWACSLFQEPLGLQSTDQSVEASRR